MSDDDKFVFNIISALSISYGDDGMVIKKGAKQSAIQSVS